MAAAETARLIASLELQDKNFTRGLKQVERGVGRVDKKLGAFSGAINRNVGRAVDSLIARGIDAGGAVIQAAVDQESAITGIAKTVNGNIDAIVDDLKKLSTETGSTFTELAGIAELGGAMGVAKDDLAAFTEQVAILGATTDVNVEDAATALGQLQNVIGLTGDEFDNFAATLVDLGNKGASTESQILEITKRAGAAAKLFHIGKAEVLGWASAVANLGINAEAGGTALSSLFQKSLPLFLKGNKTIQKVTGKTAKELKRAFEKDASGALEAFIISLSKLSEGERLATIQKLYGKNSALTKILLGLTGNTDNLTESIDDGTTAWKEGTAAAEEAEKRFATSEFLFKRLSNSINLAAATIGTELLPVLNDLAEEGMAWLNKPSTQKAIKGFAVGLGKGIRSLAKVVTSINWGSIVGFLSKAAGFAGDLVGWFNKMPDWAQAFLVGGFVATRLPVVGGLITELGKGLIKGVLGMTAGVVNINAGVVNGGGAPVPGGGAGGKLGGFKGILKLGLGLTGVGLAALLASEFEDEIQGFGEELSRGWRGVVKDNFGIDIPTISPKDIEWPFGPKNTPTILPEIFGGNGLLGGTAPKPPRRPVPSASKPPPGIGGLGAPETGGKRLLTGLGSLTSSIDRLTTKIENPPPPPKPVGAGAPGAFRPIVKAVSEQRAELNNMSNAMATLKGTSAEQKTELTNIKNASATLNTSITTQTSAQTAELGNIKNATATMDTNTKAGLVAATLATTTGNLLSVFQSASQVLAATGTTNAARTAGTTAATASRNAGSTVSSAMSTAASRIVYAIAANRPIIQSTNVVNNFTRTQRSGATSGSRGGNSFSGYR